MFFIDFKQASLPATYFRNLTLNIQESSNEQSVTKQMEQRKEDINLKSDVKDFKENIKTMNDEEIKKLMDTQK